MLSQHKEALLAFEQAIQLAPRDAYSWAFKAATLKSMGRLQEPGEAFEISKRPGLIQDDSNTI
jgi:tetratricopeptide (TPR) repeat protein